MVPWSKRTTPPVGAITVPTALESCRAWPLGSSSDGFGQSGTGMRSTRCRSKSRSLTKFNKCATTRIWWSSNSSQCWAASNKWWWPNQWVSNKWWWPNQWASNKWWWANQWANNKWFTIEHPLPNFLKLASVLFFSIFFISIKVLIWKKFYKKGKGSW